MADNPLQLLKKKRLRSLILPQLDLIGQWPGLPVEIRRALRDIRNWLNLP